MGAANAELDDARERLRSAAAADVLIIEDEPIIAMDIEELVDGCGPPGGRGGRDRGGSGGDRRPDAPGLILADIKLGHGGTAPHAVAQSCGVDAPVMFVTAYPERLLTGERPNPRS